MRKISKEDFEILTKGGGFKQTSFKNEYGEKYIVYSDGYTIYFTGDETDWQVFNLFTSDFFLWDKSELRKLGEAIVELNKE